MTPGRARIERDRAAAQLGRDLPARAPDQRPQPREDLLHPKRLGHVVVGAAVDPLDLLVPAAARRQHQHRHGEPRVAPAPQDREAVDAGQAKVEHDRVVAFRLSEEIGALAVGRAIDRIPGVAERRRELTRQPRFVFDHQDPHLTVIAQPKLNGT